MKSDRGVHPPDSHDATSPSPFPSLSVSLLPVLVFNGDPGVSSTENIGIKVGEF